MVVLPDAPLNILSLNVLYDHGFVTNGKFTEMWHKDCTHKRVKIYKKNNLSYFKVARIADRQEEIQDVEKLCLRLL